MTNFDSLDGEFDNFLVKDDDAWMRREINENRPLEDILLLALTMYLGDFDPLMPTAYWYVLSSPKTY